jgi:hypothetical protein
MLKTFYLINSRITTLPENLFSNARYLELISIANTPTLRDLPVNIFRELNNVNGLYMHNNRLNLWRPEWTQNLRNLQNLYSDRNYHIAEIPRNAINSAVLRLLLINTNLIRTFDYLSFNDVDSLWRIEMGDQPVDAVDFNFIDRAKAMQGVLLPRGNCASMMNYDINSDRENFLRMMEPCFR